MAVKKHQGVKRSVDVAYLKASHQWRGGRRQTATAPEQVRQIAETRRDVQAIEEKRATLPKAAPRIARHLRTPESITAALAVVAAARAAKKAAKATEAEGEVA